GTQLAGGGGVPGQRLDGERYPTGPAHHLGGDGGGQAGRHPADESPRCLRRHGRYGEPGRGAAPQLVGVDLMGGAQGHGKPAVTTTSPGSASAAVAVTSASAGRSTGRSAAPGTVLSSLSAGTNMGSRAGRIFVLWIPHRQASGHPTSGRNIMSDGYDGDSYT